MSSLETTRATTGPMKLGYFRKTLTQAVSRISPGSHVSLSELISTVV